MVAAANLRASMFSINGHKNIDEITSIISSMVIPPFQAKSGVKIGQLLDPISDQIAKFLEIF